MTQQEFKQARLNAVIEYARTAKKDLETETGRNKRANAQQRLDMACKRLEEIESGKFWDNKTWIAYNMLYKNCTDISAVSAF